MRIALVTDAWRPQVNGVVRTYESTGVELERAGHEVRFVTPEDFRTVPCPSYPSIRLAVWPLWKLGGLLREFDPDAIHIATEGPLGHAARGWCLKHALPFTTSFHTQFPEYIRLRAPIPVEWTYAYLRRFHGRARRTLVPTPSQAQRLSGLGFKNVVVWPRGVDSVLFRPRDKDFLKLPRPVFVYVGRVAVEKNIDAFLKCDLPGSKVVVGDGPDLARLRTRFPKTHFTGFQFGEALARHVAAADVFVFPSRTDTYGIVLLEAMACGVPVAAYPVTGPVDVVDNGVTGILDEDLGRAALAALELDPRDCLRVAAAHSWTHCADALHQYLAPIRYEGAARPVPDAAATDRPR